MTLRSGEGMTAGIGMQLHHRERTILQPATFRGSVLGKGVPNTIPLVHLIFPLHIDVKGTDFSSVKDTDWEKVRLQRELTALNEKVENAEAEARRRRMGTAKNPSSKSALVKRELEQMLEFKRRELNRLKDGEDIEKSGNLDRVRAEIQNFKEQVDALAAHLARRQEELRNVQQSIETV